MTATLSQNAIETFREWLDEVYVHSADVNARLARNKFDQMLAEIRKSVEEIPLDYQALYREPMERLVSLDAVLTLLGTTEEKGE